MVAATSRLWAALLTSFVAMFAFNFFFLPPLRTLVISDPQNWVALFAFLVVSLVASKLATAARDREQEAVGRRDEQVAHVYRRRIEQAGHGVGGEYGRADDRVGLVHGDHHPVRRVGQHLLAPGPEPVRPSARDPAATHRAEVGHAADQRH